ncbi:MAG: helix-turn-helix domain-containing protein [Hyphomicrobium sp.]
MSRVSGGAAGQRLALLTRGGHVADVEVRQIIAHNCATTSRYFIELRLALRVTPQHAAQLLHTNQRTIESLETGQIEALPAWPETARIVSAYALMAGIDGRPALALISETLGLIADVQSAEASAASALAALQPARRQAGSRFRNAVSAGARLPQDALRGVRRRPDRMFYALSLPLALVLLAALDPPALNRAKTAVGDYFQVHFAGVHEGFRWIEVSDPRARRADKLQGGKR